MLEAERIAKDPSVKGFNDLDELFADLKRWKKPICDVIAIKVILT
jgi:hypothetical protein